MGTTAGFEQTVLFLRLPTSNLDSRPEFYPWALCALVPIHAGQLTLPRTLLVAPRHHDFAAIIPPTSPVHSSPKIPLNYTLQTSEFYSRDFFYCDKIYIAK